MKQKNIISKSEHIAEALIVGVVGIVLIIALLISFGARNIELWLSSSVKWEDPDYINVTLLDKKESESNMELNFLIENRSLQDFDNYDIYLNIEDNLCNLRSVTAALNSFSTCEKELSFAEGGSLKRMFKAIEGKDVSEIEMTYHVKYLGYHDEDLLDYKWRTNSFIILVIALLAAIIGFTSLIKTKWLRMIFKFIAVPILLIMLVMYMMFGVDTGTDSVASAENSARQRAAEQYKRAAQHKAAAEMNGHTDTAIRAQLQMDKAYADMMGKSGSSDAKERYKRAAQHKAGAMNYGNKAEAARAQARMDKAFADMMNERKK